MSILTRLVAWLGRLSQGDRKSPHPDRMALRDWADLPAHHPECG